MCLYVDSELKTAEKDIRVYKALTIDFITPYKCFKYERGKTYETRMSLKKKRCNSVYIGFHSCRTPQAVKDLHCDWFANKVFSFIIPKGAKYYFGMDGDIVSNKIHFPKLKSKK